MTIKNPEAFINALNEPPDLLTSYQISNELVQDLFEAIEFLSWDALLRMIHNTIVFRDLPKPYAANLQKIVYLMRKEGRSWRYALANYDEVKDGGEL